jgi:hypothetical protein
MSIPISGHNVCGVVQCKLLKLLRIDHMDCKLSFAESEVWDYTLAIIKYHCQKALGKKINHIQIGRISQALDQLSFIARLDVDNATQFSKNVPEKLQFLSTECDEEVYHTTLQKSFVGKSCTPFASFNKKCDYKTLEFYYGLTPEEQKWEPVRSDSTWVKAALRLKTLEAQTQFIQDHISSEWLEASLFQLQQAKDARKGRRKRRLEHTDLLKTVKKLKTENADLYSKILALELEKKDLELALEDTQIDLLLSQERTQTSTEDVAPKMKRRKITQ